MVKRTTPSAHMSLALPEYGAPVKIEKIHILKEFDKNLSKEKIRK